LTKRTINRDLWGPK